MAECETYLKGKGNYIPEEWKSYPIESTKKLLAVYIDNFDEMCFPCIERVRINKILELKGFLDILYRCFYTNSPEWKHFSKKGGYNIIILEPKKSTSCTDRVKEVIFVSLDEIPDIKKEVEEEYEEWNKDIVFRYKIIENHQIDIQQRIANFNRTILIGET
jgi:hypothetical protein